MRGCVRPVRSIYLLAALGGGLEVVAWNCPFLPSWGDGGFVLFLDSHSMNRGYEEGRSQESHASKHSSYL